MKCETVGCSQCRGLLPVVWLCVAIQEWNDKVPQPQGLKKHGEGAVDSGGRWWEGDSG